MNKHSNTPIPKKSASGRTSSRRQGQRPTADQKREAQAAFLEAFVAYGNLRSACIVAGIDRSTVYTWAEHDEQFNLRYNQAKEDVNDAVRAEIYHRAMFGEEEPLVSMGKAVMQAVQGEDGRERLAPVMVRRKSDVLLMFYAKSRMPEFRDKQQLDVNANVTTPNTGLEDLRLLTSEQLKALKGWLLEAKTRQ